MMKMDFGLGLWGIVHITRSIRLPTKHIHFFNLHKCKTKYVFFSSSVNSFLNNLILEEGSKREANISKYIELISNKSSHFVGKSDEYKTVKPYGILDHKTMGSLNSMSSEELMDHLEVAKLTQNNVLCDKLHLIMFFLSKSGNVNGVKSVQLFIKKHNVSEFNLKSGFKHYLAEALWINGNIEVSISLFSEAYDNVNIQNQVKSMMASLFPLLIAKHSEGTLRKSVLLIMQFACDKNDHILPSCLWKELFLSGWFSDQQIAHQIIEENTKLIQFIQWMIPSMGKQLLTSHCLEDFHRLLEFALRNDLKQFSGVLVRLLFDYHCIHQNIERCSAVVKYSTDINSYLTEDQLKRYIALLLKCKNSASSKKIIKKPQNLKYDF